MKKDKLKNKVKVGIAGLLLGTTLLTGVACANKNNTEVFDDIDTKITVDNGTQDFTQLRTELTKVINDTFNEDYMHIKGATAGKTVVLEGGIETKKRIGCVTAPNGDNVSWYGDEYYAICTDGQAFFNKSEYPEQVEQYVSFKDSLLDVVNDENHTIVKINNNTYEINDNDCNVYRFFVIDGKLCKIQDTYVEHGSKVGSISEIEFNKIDFIKFETYLNNAINQIEDAQEYFNGLSK